jgi:GNAT superfamily N-acetyltransferase
MPGETTGVDHGLQCRVSAYEGFEREVMALRNSNREVAQSSDYLSWRYAAQSCAAAPQVYWLDQAGGVSVGMASLVPRRYWIDGCAQAVGVLGDISLDATQRGKGLGKLLLEFMTRQIDREAKLPWCLVIPTPAARHALRSAGWVEGGSLVRRALLLEPLGLLARKLPGALARGISRAYRTTLRGFLRLSAGSGELSIGENFGAEFEEFWRAFPKHGLGIADHGVATLEWRYSGHPRKRFRIAALRGDAGLQGYLVFECSDSVCSIYDVLAKSNASLRTIVTKFIARMMADGLASISVTLNDSHPYQATFARMGFIARDRAVFQLHRSVVNADEPALTWMLTQGDKDV